MSRLDKAMVLDTYHFKLQSELDDAARTTERTIDGIEKAIKAAEGIRKECLYNANILPNLQESISKDNLGSVVDSLAEIEKIYLPQLQRDIANLKKVEKLEDINNHLNNYIMPAQIIAIRKINRAAAILGQYTGGLAIKIKLDQVRDLEDALGHKLGVVRDETDLSREVDTTGDLTVAKIRLRDLGFDVDDDIMLDGLRDALQSQTNDDFAEKLEEMADAIEPFAEVGVIPESMIEKITETIQHAINNPNEFDFETLLENLNKLKKDKKDKPSDE